VKPHTGQGHGGALPHLPAHPSAIPDVPFRFRRAELVTPLDAPLTMEAHDLLSLKLHIHVPDIPDLWQRVTAAGAKHLAELGRLLGQTAADELGPEFVVMVGFRPGSIVASVTGWLRKSWSTTGNAIASGANSVSVNVSRLCRKLSDTVTEFFKRVRSNPTIKAVVKVTVKYLPKALNLASGIATILGWLGIPGGELLQAVGNMMTGAGYQPV